MLKKSKDNKQPSKETKKGISKYFTILNLSTAIITFLASCLFMYIIYLRTGNMFNYNYLYGLLIIIIAIEDILSYIIFNKLFNNFALFEEGLTRVSNGDYSIKIDTTNMKMFNVMANNFNKMTSELNNSKKLSDDFVKNFSHEFKTPISSIKGFAEVLKYEELSKEEQSKYLDIIEKESSRLANLSEKVLFLSKLNSQSVIKDKMEYDLDEQIKKCVILLQKSWEEKNIVINLDLEKVKYYNNSEIMNQVWINLINNSIKYTPESGQINIKLKSKKEKIIFEISDNGIGIEKEKIQYIFNEYYQCDTSHKTKGVGLGLSIVKRILDLSDATISVKSIVNEGTTFIVTLPI